MPRTLSVSPIDGEHPEFGDDLDNRVADGIESLRQRIQQRLQFRLGEWELDTRRGTRSVLGFTYTPNLAAAVISAAIREEGAAEVTGLRDVLATLDGETRGFFYDVTVDTIYGAMRLTGTAV